MQILVIGANGFIGRHIVRAAVARHGKAAVVAGVRRVAGAGIFPDGVEQRIVDVTDRDALTRALAGITHVVGSVMGGEAAMVAAAAHVAEAVAAGSIERFVHLSSIAVHGAAQGAVGETPPTARPADRYAAAKAEAEAAIARLAPGASVILRPGLVYGPGSDLWTVRIAALLRQGRLGDLGAAGTGTCALVHVDDVADAAVAACTGAGLGGRIFHLVAAPAPDWNTYLTDFARALGLPVRRISPMRLMMERLAAYPLRLARGMGISVPEAITPGLARLFGRQVRFETSAVPALLPRWRDLATGIADGVR